MVIESKYPHWGRGLRLRVRVLESPGDSGQREIQKLTNPSEKSVKSVSHKSRIKNHESRIPHDFHEVAQFVFDLRAVGQGLSDLVTHGVAEVTSETVHRHLQRAVAQSQLGTDP